jgi:hypothetical protein
MSHFALAGELTIFAAKFSLAGTNIAAPSAASESDGATRPPSAENGLRRGSLRSRYAPN